MKDKVRHIKVAGQFYEKDPVRLQCFIDNAKTEVKKDNDSENVKAVILPHAGYIFSGKTAIKTLALAHKKEYKNIFIIAPSHYVGFEGVALSIFEEYETPFGNIEVNKEIIKELSEKGFIVNNEAHNLEHSLEVQLPIVKEMFSKAKIIPIVCGFINNNKAFKLAEDLEKYWKDDNNLWIISSDFTHFGRSFNYMPFADNIKENIYKLDGKAIDEILNVKPEAFYNYVIRTGITICGKFPILILLYLAKNHSEEWELKTELIEYLTSGDLSGDYHHCVSYAGIVFRKLSTGKKQAGNSETADNKDKEQKKNSEDKVMEVYTELQKREMLRLARKTIEDKLNRTKYSIADKIPDYLLKTGSCFVTLHTATGHLRGCIGNIIAFEPLYDNIRHNALNSAFSDLRFPKLSSLEEFRTLNIEISVLTSPKKINSYKDIILGKHGIILKSLGRSSVFLPQVAPEQGWDIETTLTHLSLKAGLPNDAWQKTNTVFEVFEAIVFKEK